MQLEIKEKEDAIRKRTEEFQVGVYILKVQLRSFRYHGNSPPINSHTALTPSSLALQERITLGGAKILGGEMTIPIMTATMGYA